MTCRSAEDAIQKSLDGVLTLEERSRLDAHLTGCPACRREWEAHRALARAAWRWARPTPEDDPGDAFTAQVLAQVAARPVSMPVYLPFWLPLAASALLLTCLALLAGPFGPSLDSLGGAARQTPDWLLTNLRAVPGDVSGIWGALTLGLSLPAWVWGALPAVAVVNGMFCVQARQAQTQRSLP